MAGGRQVLCEGTLGAHQVAPDRCDGTRHVTPADPGEDLGVLSGDRGGIEQMRGLDLGHAEPDLAHDGAVEPLKPGAARGGDERGVERKVGGGEPGGGDGSQRPDPCICFDRLVRHRPQRGDPVDGLHLEAAAESVEVGDVGKPSRGTWAVLLALRSNRPSETSRSMAAFAVGRATSYLPATATSVSGPTLPGSARSSSRSASVTASTAETVLTRRAVVACVLAGTTSPSSVFQITC